MSWCPWCSAQGLQYSSATFNFDGEEATFAKFSLFYNCLACIKFLYLSLLSYIKRFLHYAPLNFTVTLNPIQ